MAEEQTGWIRYQIVGKGGIGRNTDRWIYCPWLADEDEETVLDYIVRHRETWALYAESYNYEIETNATPPKNEIREAIKNAEEKVKFYRDEAEALTSQLLRLIKGKKGL